MKNKLFFCLLALPLFVRGLGPLTDRVKADANIEPVGPHQFKDKNEAYQLMVSFAQAYASQAFAQLTKDGVVFPNIDDKSKMHEITYQQANEILYKYAKKIASVVNDINKEKRVEEQEINPMVNQKATIDQLTSRQKYLLTVVLMGHLHGAHVDKNVFNRIVYRNAWAMRDVEKIKETLNLSLYNVDHPFISLVEIFKLLSERKKSF